MSNPCLSCGACCAYYRVSFYWSEADPFLGGGVPQQLTVPINRHLVAMRGTTTTPARCCALEGDVGQQVHCSIYAQRPGVCHELMYSGHQGRRDEKCDRARSAHGLPPLGPGLNPANDPPPALPQSA